MKNLPRGTPESAKKTAWLFSCPSNACHGVILDQKGGREAPYLDDLGYAKVRECRLRLGPDYASREGRVERPIEQQRSERPLFRLAAAPTIPNVP